MHSIIRGVRNKFDQLKRSSICITVIFFSKSPGEILTQVSFIPVDLPDANYWLGYTGLKTKFEL